MTEFVIKDSLILARFWKQNLPEGGVDSVLLEKRNYLRKWGVLFFILE